jgi:hypothetical protein
MEIDKKTRTLAAAEMPAQKLSSIDDFDDELVVKIIPIQNSEGAFASLSTSNKSTKLIVALSYLKISIDFDKKHRNIFCEGEWMSTTTNTRGGTIKWIVSIIGFRFVSLIGLSNLSITSLIDIIGQTGLIGPSALLARQLVSLIGFIDLVGPIKLVELIGRVGHTNDFVGPSQLIVESKYSKISLHFCENCRIFREGEWRKRIIKKDGKAIINAINRNNLPSLAFGRNLAFGLNLAFVLTMAFSLIMAFGCNLAFGLITAFGHNLAFGLTMAFGLIMAFGLFSFSLYASETL